MFKAHFLVSYVLPHNATHESTDMHGPLYVHLFTPLPSLCVLQMQWQFNVVTSNRACGVNPFLHQVLKKKY
jgi:hypothetical protein